MHPSLRAPARLLGFAVVGVAVLAGPVRAEDAPEGKALDEFFSGQVLGIERGVVSIRYDFSDKNQMNDWFESVPFPVKRQSDQGVALVDGAMEIKGSTAVRHIAAWNKDMQVTAKLKLGETRNIGGMLTPEPDTHDFATFTLREYYFHSWDRGQRGGQHTILKFGDKFRLSAGIEEYIGFRYVARKPPKKPLIVDRTYPLAFGIKRGRLLMEIDGVDLKGPDIGVKLKAFRPGFYTVKARVLVDDVVIVGTLDPEWMRTTGVALRIANPAPEKDD